MKYKIISVESRKGGVGKTTAALNLSRLLIDKGYDVLLIDIDITGTNIVDALDSSYWKQIINPIKHKGKNANLLNIYQDLYMRGLKLPSWKTKSDEDEIIDFGLRKNNINILGSEIYNNVSNNNQNNLICNPSLLFDELHAYWFVEYLQQICNSFANKINNKKIAVILDNSPGFVGINPAIHEWLTDIGPVNGKFLTISSLDKQDLISCSRAIDNLHGLFQNKFIGAKLYAETIKKSPIKDFNLSGVSKSFYLRIASKNLNEDATEAYNLQNINKIDFTKKPNLYQAIIINKVPMEIKDNSFLYDFSDIRYFSGNGRVMNELLGNHNNENINHLVFYDEYINLQFVEPSLSRNSKAYDRRSNLSIVRRHFSRLETKIINNRKETKYNDNLSISNINYDVIEKNIELYQNELDKLIDRLKRSNLRNIVRLISKEWYPETPIETLRQYFNEFLIDYSHSNFDYEDNIEKSDRMKMFFKEFAYQIERQLRNNKMSQIFYDNSMYNPSFNAVLYLVVSPFLGDKHTLEELTEITSAILSIQLERFSEYQSNSENKRQSIREFLISESKSKLSLNNEKLYRLIKRSNRKISRNEVFITDFYNSFCKAQIRIIDIDEDFDFLIDVLKQISCGTENRKEILFPYIKDALDNVIVLKTIPHSRANNEMQKGFKSATYMTEFQESLSSIIEKWGVK
ncbi:MAG: ParA family protein [Salinivirgaceae bacterium]|nr:ParA family protein [Salinivirgaceae bacterium]